MLILTRRPNESIIIDGHIKIKVLGIKGNQIRIGIDCDKSIPVHREEIYLEIQRENRYDQ